ncbi:hypothetical protein [Marinivivus vitaminiproducens]|uniref:hypothetical protein n=1 Tax=Marinivivus vitaminiproducens TaxID=3035935 RepID=UPI00279D4D40|nr:hypothetical protein P4R82_23695 [Geminicoccaceae bacterium SCSIO 64248]
MFFPAQSNDLAESPSAQAVNARKAAWEGEIAGEDQALWHWLEALDDDRRMTLLAHCVSYGVNALSERPNPHTASGTTKLGTAGDGGCAGGPSGIGKLLDKKRCESPSGRVFPPSAQPERASTTSRAGTSP